MTPIYAFFLGVMLGVLLATALVGYIQGWKL